MAKIPLHPKHPERVCWGCDRYCRADALVCGNGTIRTQHPVELFGEDWMDWSIDNRHSESEADTNTDPSLVPVDSLGRSTTNNR